MDKLILNYSSAGFWVNNSLFDITNTTFVAVALYLSIISCGIYVITSKNPIVSVLFLILLFSIVACYLIQLTASFIGLSYLLVYVGAVSILFLFILMLINVRISELVTDNNNSVPLSLFIISIFIIVSRISMTLSNSKENIPLQAEEAIDIGLAKNAYYLNFLSLNDDNTFITDNLNNINDLHEGIKSVDLLEDFKITYLSKLFTTGQGPYNDSLYSSTSYTWDTFITTISHINSIGNIMYTSYPILLLIISIILLLSMIGAIIITVRR